MTCVSRNQSGASHRVKQTGGGGSNWLGSFVGRLHHDEARQDRPSSKSPYWRLHLPYLKAAPDR